MAQLISNLGKTARIVAFAAVAGAMASGSAMAANCNSVTGTWTTAFNTAFGCNTATPAPECAILTDIDATCCSESSTPGEQQSCVNSECQANSTLFTSIGINISSCN